MPGPDRTFTPSVTLYGCGAGSAGTVVVVEVVPSPAADTSPELSPVMSSAVDAEQRGTGAQPDQHDDEEEHREGESVVRAPGASRNRR